MQKLFGTQLETFVYILRLNIGQAVKSILKISLRMNILVENSKTIEKYSLFRLVSLCIIATHILNSFRIPNPFRFSFAESFPIQRLTCTHTYQLLSAMDQIL